MTRFSTQESKTVTYSYDGVYLTHEIPVGMDAYTYTAMLVINQKKQIDELHNRIDTALYHLDFNHDHDKDIAINILKGNQDEK